MYSFWVVNPFTRIPVTPPLTKTVGCFFFFFFEILSNNYDQVAMIFDGLFIYTPLYELVFSTVWRCLNENKRWTIEPKVFNPTLPPTYLRSSELKRTSSNFQNKQLLVLSYNKYITDKGQNSQTKIVVVKYWFGSRFVPNYNYHKKGKRVIRETHVMWLLSPTLYGTGNSVTLPLCKI